MRNCERQIKVSLCSKNTCQLETLRLNFELQFITFKCDTHHTVQPRLLFVHPFENIYDRTELISSKISTPSISICSTRSLGSARCTLTSAGSRGKGEGIRRSSEQQTRMSVYSKNIHDTLTAETTGENFFKFNFSKFVCVHPPLFQLKVLPLQPFENCLRTSFKVNRGRDRVESRVCIFKA